MAHECPDCGQLCHCNGDIDDCILNCEEDVIACDHYLQCGVVDECDDFIDDGNYDPIHDKK